MSPALVPKPKDWKNHIGMLLLPCNSVRIPTISRPCRLLLLGPNIVLQSTGRSSELPFSKSSTHLFRVRHLPLKQFGYINECILRFGSIVMEDPKTMSEVILEAVKNTGSRALISSGWAELCKDSEIPDNVFILGNVPHDWLFDKVSAVCHHGGAGTTAIGLRMGKPTIIVPFFGDQPFWGRRLIVLRKFTYLSIL